MESTASAELLSSSSSSSSNPTPPKSMHADCMASNPSEANGLEPVGPSSFTSEDELPPMRSQYGVSPVYECKQEEPSESSSGTSSFSSEEREKYEDELNSDIKYEPTLAQDIEMVLFNDMCASSHTQTSKDPELVYNEYQKQVENESSEVIESHLGQDSSGECNYESITQKENYAIAATEASQELPSSFSAFVPYTNPSTRYDIMHSHQPLPELAGANHYLDSKRNYSLESSGYSLCPSLFPPNGFSQNRNGREDGTCFDQLNSQVKSPPSSSSSLFPGTNVGSFESESSAQPAHYADFHYGAQELVSNGREVSVFVDETREEIASNPNFLCPSYQTPISYATTLQTCNISRNHYQDSNNFKVNTPIESVYNPSDCNMFFDKPIDATVHNRNKHFRDYGNRLDPRDRFLATCDTAALTKEIRRSFSQAGLLVKEEPKSSSSSPYAYQNPKERRSPSSIPPGSPEKAKNETVTKCEPSIIEDLKNSFANNNIEKRSSNTPDTTKTTDKSTQSKTEANDQEKPKISYVGLIAQALKSSPEKKLTLRGIYTYITNHYPYYKKENRGWQNSIRHNLSLNACFIKMRREASHSGEQKGNWWLLAPGFDDMFEDGSFKRRKKIRKPRNNYGAKAYLAEGNARFSYNMSTNYHQNMHPYQQTSANGPPNVCPFPPNTSVHPYTCSYRSFSPDPLDRWTNYFGQVQALRSTVSPPRTVPAYSEGSQTRPYPFSMGSALYSDSYTSINCQPSLECNSYTNTQQYGHFG